MKFDVLIFEIGSTTTLVSALNIGNKGIVSDSENKVVQAVAETTPYDICVGVNNAINNLSSKLNDKVEYNQIMAASSAAGGLKMTVHGLVYDMTVKAAREAALGAGAIIKHTTSGKLEQYDIDKVIDISPNLILLSGGTDYGDSQTAIYNAKVFANSVINVPFVYAGNCACASQVEQILTYAGKKCVVVENVYPSLDQINIQPTRNAIQQVFEEHITNANGMSNIRKLIKGHIMPTPAAVMQATMLLQEEIGDCITIDVGGATTDVHSVGCESSEIAQISVAVEPYAKRTVEGDLGMFINADNVANIVGYDKLSSILRVDAKQILSTLSAIPTNEIELKLVKELAYIAASTAIIRHAGVIKYNYTASGRQPIAVGKDLSNAKYLIATGGVLTQHPDRKEILSSLTKLNSKGNMLYPPVDRLQVLIDNDYIMAAAGVLSLTDRQAALDMLKKSLRI